MAQKTFVRACQECFSDDDGLPISIPEFKALTRNDKLDLIDELRREGFDVADLKEKVSESAA